MTDEQAPEANSTQKQPRVFPLVPWLVYQIKRKRDERRAEREKETSQDRSARVTACATRVIAVFAVVAAILGISQSIIADWQLGSMQGQLAVLQSDERPWVYLDQAIPDNPLKYDPATGFSFGIIYAAKNVGKTVARRVYIAPGAIGVAADICSNVKTSTGLKNAVFPNGYYSLIQSHGISKAEIDRLPTDASGAKTIKPSIPGCINYRTTYDNTLHQTGFVVDILVRGAYPFTFDPKIEQEIRPDELKLRASVTGEPT